MIDTKYLNEIIADEYDTTRLIDENDLITKDVFALLCKKQSRFLKCFVSYKDKDKHYFKVELPCERCGKLTLRECTKTKLQEYCFGKRHRYQFICDECRKKEEKDKEKQKNGEEAIQRNTENYILNYLDPKTRWKESTAQTEKEYWVERAFTIDDNVIANYILGMDYSDFLLTPYWKAIAGKIRRKAGYKCQICGRQEKLSVHHRSYENHGLEHTYAGQRDLIAICQECHEKFHFE